MSGIKKKANTKGETLVETLVAILILTFSAMLLAEVSATAIRMNQEIEAVDTKYRDELAGVEKREVPFSGEVTIKSGGNTYHYQVDFYGDGVGLTSYQSKTGGI